MARDYATIEHLELHNASLPANAALITEHPIGMCNRGEVTEDIAHPAVTQQASKPNPFESRA